MPDAEILEKGGRMHGFQLWVNLPARDKMTRPRYQEIPAEKIPTARTPDGKVAVKVIAGEALGVAAVIETRTTIFYFHLTMKKDGEVFLPVPQDFNAFAYVFKGKAAAGAGAAADGQAALFAADGDGVSLRAAEDAEVLLIGGRPLNEPVARYGPFVMNKEEEIYQAFADFRAGRLGRIA
jgi:redox-sensitive bicupin YhaK (pirin superfamily)